jgi:hypothetical protein
LKLTDRKQDTGQAELVKQTQERSLLGQNNPRDLKFTARNKIQDKLNW